MSDGQPRASVVVAIGGDARLYYALITSPQRWIDAPPRSHCTPRRWPRSPRSRRATS